MTKVIKPELRERLVERGTGMPDGYRVVNPGVSYVRVVPTVESEVTRPGGGGGTALVSLKPDELLIDDNDKIPVGHKIVRRYRVVRAPNIVESAESAEAYVEMIRSRLGPLAADAVQQLVDHVKEDK